MDERVPPRVLGGDRPVGRPSGAAASISVLVNVVSVGVGGLYLSTRSTAVTVIGAALVALLAVAVLVAERKKR